MTAHGAKRDGWEIPFVEITYVYATKYAIEVLARLDEIENVDCKN
jgi:hypothetical protein